MTNSPVRFAAEQADACRQVRASKKSSREKLAFLHGVAARLNLSGVSDMTLDFAQLLIHLGFEAEAEAKTYVAGLEETLFSSHRRIDELIDEAKEHESLISALKANISDKDKLVSLMADENIAAQDGQPPAFPSAAQITDHDVDVMLGDGTLN